MKKYCAISAITLMGLQLALVLFSWIVSAVVPSANIHSLIGSGGIRWLIGSFTDNMLSPLLAYIVLASISYSAVVKSGLCAVFANRRALSMQQKFALRVMAVELLVFVAVLLFVTAAPHAILLSVTGALFPSSFSSGLVPLLCFQLFVLSIIYGVVSGTVNTLEKFWDCATSGANFLLAVCFLYLLTLQLYTSFCYVMEI